MAAHTHTPQKGHLEKLRRQADDAGKRAAAEFKKKLKNSETTARGAARPGGKGAPEAKKPRFTATEIDRMFTHPSILKFFYSDCNKMSRGKRGWINARSECACVSHD